MAIISDLIKYEGDNSTFIWKYPLEDFNSMTELVVHESQEAVFFANGQIADVFGPGRYQLSSENIPILAKLTDQVTGVSIFHCEVYFINKTVQMAIRWGTDSKVRFIEPRLGIPIELGASGEMNLALSDGRKMLTTLIGTMKGIAWDEGAPGFTKSLQNAFRPLISNAIKTNLPAVITQQNIDILEIDTHLDILSDAVKQRIQLGFEEYGLTVPQFYMTNVALPETDQNFRRLRELHAIELQKRVAEAEAEVRTVQAQSRTAYATAEANSEAAIAAAKRQAVLEVQTTETEIARREAERKVIAAQAAAEAAKMAGLAEAQVMQAKGYNQKDVIQADVQKAYAEGIGNMGHGGAGNGGTMGEMLGLGVGVAAASAIAPQIGGLFSNIQANNRNNGICRKCGTTLSANAKFCHECGAKVESPTDNEIICPTCGKRTQQGKFCAECGQPLLNRCSNCNAEVRQGSSFCPDCGTRL